MPLQGNLRGIFVGVTPPEDRLDVHPGEDNIVEGEHSDMSQLGLYHYQQIMKRRHEAGKAPGGSVNMLRYSKAMPDYWYKPAGKPYAPEFIEMLGKPHLLIRGGDDRKMDATLNGIIVSAITYYTPSEVMFSMIDLNGRALRHYIELPHTLSYFNSKVLALKLLIQIDTYVLEQHREMAARKLIKTDMPQHLYLVIDDLDSLLAGRLGSSMTERLERILQMGPRANVHVLACTRDHAKDPVPPRLAFYFKHRECISAPVFPDVHIDEVVAHWVRQRPDVSK